ncbi:MAG: glycosyltransferase family 4 protein [Candidatus Hodarchaeota archaeon]
MSFTAVNEADGMPGKMKIFWLNLGFLDRDMDLSERMQILQALAEQEVEVRTNFNYIKTPIKTPLPIDGLDKVWILSRRAKGVLGTIFLFAEQQLTLIKNFCVDVIVVSPFNLHQAVPLWLLCRKILRRQRPKFVMDVRTLPVDLPDNWRGRLRQKRFNAGVYLAFQYFDGLTMITEKMKTDLQKETNNFEKEICVWSSGVDPKLFDPDNVDDFTEKLGFQDRFVIMYHGFLSPNRGLQQAIEAIAMVRKKYPEIMLLLLGKGPAQTELEEHIRNLRLENHVLIHPPVPFEEVPGYIKSAQVGILPFPDLHWWNTSSPIKLNEYMAMKKPVIVTDIVAHRVVLGKQKCGFYVPDNKPASLARSIKTVLERKSELSALGEIARKKAIEHFTWEKQARKIKAYFQALFRDGSVSLS